MEYDVLLMVGTVADVTYRADKPCLEAVLLQQFSVASPFPVGLFWFDLPLGHSPFSLPPSFFFSFPVRICFVPIFTSFIWYSNIPKAQTGKGKAELFSLTEPWPMYLDS